MTRRYQQTLTRRTLLRGAGVALAMPLLESLSPRTAFGALAQPGPQRIVAINIPLGFHGPSFFPTEVGENYTATASLAPAAAIRDKFTLISGTSHPDVDGGHSAEVSFLTAAPHPGARSFKNTISLDQLIARQVGSQTRFGSLTLGMNEAPTGPVQLPTALDSKAASVWLVPQTTSSGPASATGPETT